MAVNNRTEAISQVNTLIVPQVTNAIHRDLLNNNILNSILFRKDAIGTATPSGVNVTTDFTNYDLITVTTADNLLVTLAGLVNGDIKFLHITKLATKTIDFASCTNVTNFQRIIDDLATSVIYMILNKNGANYCIALYETMFEGSKAYIGAEDYDRIATCGAVKSYLDDNVTNEIPWINLSSTGDFVGTVKYRKNHLGHLEIMLNGGCSGGTSIGTLPVGYRPNYSVRQIQWVSDTKKWQLEIIGTGAAGLTYDSTYNANDIFFTIPLTNS